MRKLDIDKLKDCLYMQDEVIAAYIFGSYASERPEAARDIDIAVLLDGSINKEDYGFIKLSITTELIKCLSFDNVDVVIMNIAAPLISHEIIKKGQLLFSKDEKARLTYIVKATMIYLDTKYLRNVQDRILHEKIRRGDFGYFKGSHKYSIEKVRKGHSDTSTVR